MVTYPLRETEREEEEKEKEEEEEEEKEEGGEEEKEEDGEVGEVQRDFKTVTNPGITWLQQLSNFCGEYIHHNQKPVNLPLTIFLAQYSKQIKLTTITAYLDSILFQGNSG